MRTVYKYQLNIVDKQTVDIVACNGLTVREQLLSVAIQHDVLCLWALADTELVTHKRRVTIAVHGTGHKVEAANPHENYIGSFMMLNGSFVGHVFLVSE